MIKKIAGCGCKINEVMSKPFIGTGNKCYYTE